MTTILPRRGTAAEWTAANPVLAAGEMGLETDTNQSKRGDGATAWAALPYVGKWDSIPGKPTVVAEGATQAAARTAIGAVDQAAVTAAIDAVIAGAPGALDTLSELAAALGDDANFAATITTALAGKQPLDADLTAIAALTPADNDIAQRKSGAWTSRTPAQLKTDLALTKADVGLGSADNTADADKPVSTAQQAALNTKASKVIINVKDYGAVGDNVTDDTNAFTQAVSSLAPNSTLYVPHGRYRVSAIPAMPDGSYIRGDGTGASRILQTGWADQSFIRWTGSMPDTVLATLTDIAGNGASVLTVDSTDNLVVDGLYRLGGTSPYSSTDPLMYKGEIIRVQSIDSATSISIYGLVRDRYTVVEGSVLYPYIYKSDVGIQDISIVNTEPGVHKKGLVQFYACRNVSVHNVHLSGGDQHGIQLGNVLNASVSGCHIENGKDDTPNGFYGYGISVGRASDNITISNCRFERLRHGFTCDSVDNTAGIPRNIVVSGCVAEDTSDAAFDTHPSGAIITFVGCSATRCATGFQVRSKDTRILSCTVSYCRADGVIFNGECDGSSLVGSVIRQLRRPSSGRAVRIDGAPDRLVIKGNTFDSLFGYGIAVNSNARRMKVLDNLFSHLGGDTVRTTAIWFSNGISDGVGHVIAGNTFIANEAATNGETAIPVVQMSYAVDFGTGAITGSYVVNNLAIGLASGMVNNPGSNTVSNNIVI